MVECPCCKGSRKESLGHVDATCVVCGGSKRVTDVRALQHAALLAAERRRELAAARTPTVGSKRAIYKFTIDVGAGETETRGHVPLGSKTLCAQVQYGKVAIWVELDPVAWERGVRVERVWSVIGTGHQFDENALGEYVGTVQYGGGSLVLHVYERRTGYTLTDIEAMQAQERIK